MNIIDISNWTINEINNSINTFKDTSLTDIGMVNCDIESINIVGGITTATLWINEDIGIDGYTGAAPLKVYKEDKVEIKLNSPLLMGDTIEIVDGKLCHYHKMGKVVLDGSEDWKIEQTNGNLTRYYIDSDKGLIGFYPNSIKHSTTSTLFGTTFASWGNGVAGFYLDTTISNRSWISIPTSMASTVSDLLSLLQANPTTVVYELIEPYYEEITPHQSSIILKTFNESSMIINTNLPIKTNVSYRTNVPSISTLSNRVTEVSESDNVIHNLINIIDDEVDE